MENAFRRRQKKFAPLCPEFVIEVRSKSDNIEDLKKKMSVWIANGTHLAWLIDPVDRMNYIFHSDGSVDTLPGFGKKITAEKPVEGFELDLSLLQ